VAKAVTLVPVQVLGCDGFGDWSWIIAGIDWVTATHTGPSVANLSIGGYPYQPVDDALTRSIASGVTYAVSAGNDDTDACERSPARTPSALTVGAISSNDRRWDWENGTGSDYGPCVDLFAPGDGIASASASGDDASEFRTGTSMAAPHVAGVAALYLQHHPGATPAQVTAAILGSATPGAVADAGSGSPNLLLWSDPGDDTGTDPVTGPAPQPSLRAEQRSYDGDPTDNAIRPALQLRNTGSSATDLTRVTVRYWFTRDGGPGTFLTACEYVALGCGHVHLKVVALPTPRPGADRYLEVGFDAGSVPAGGATGELKLRLHATDWSPLDERDDYSRGTGSAFTPSGRITVYAGGRLVWGSEP
jgi:subtilisin family serine protease